MASVRSLGLHRPAALEYLISRAILPKNPASTLYKWVVYEQADEYGEEELIITRDCVVWSQSTVIRRIFRFSLWDKKVADAVLTWLPAEEATSDDLHPSQDDDRPLHRALVVLIGREAHIYFVQGSAHVVKVPFEVERGIPTAQGLLLQRKQSNVGIAQPTLAQPSVPPNSLQPSQASVWESSSLGLNEHKGNHPPIAPNINVKVGPLPELAIRQSHLARSKVARRVILTDPVSAPNNVVEVRKSFLGPSSLNVIEIDEDEDIVYVSPSNELKNFHAPYQQVLALVLTYNRRKQCYTLWYALMENDNIISAQRSMKKKSSKRFGRSKRRSSYTTRLNSGSTTPGVRYQDGLKTSIEGKHMQASFAGSQTARSRLSETFNLDEDDETEFSGKAENQFIPRGKSKRDDRRASSIMARAELSSQDPPTFTYVTRNMRGVGSSWGSVGLRGQKSGGQSDRNSFGRSRLSGRASTPGSFSLLSDLDETPQKDYTPVDIVEDLTASDPFENVHERSLLDESGLNNRLMMIKVATIPSYGAHSPGSIPLHPWTDKMKVFSLPSPEEHPDTRSSNPTLRLFLVNSEKTVVQELLIETRLMSLSTNKASLHKPQLVVPSGVSQIRTHNTIKGIARVHDSRLSRLIILDSNTHERPSSTPGLRIQCSMNSTVTFAASSRLPAHPLEIAANHVQSGSDSLCDYSQLRTPLFKGPASQQPENILSPKQVEYGSAHGKVHLLDTKNERYTIQVQMSPQNQYIAKILSLCDLVLISDLRTDDQMQAKWQYISKTECSGDTDCGWRALIITILYTVLQMLHPTPEISQSENETLGTTHGRKRSFDSCTEKTSWHWLQRQLILENPSSKTASRNTFLLNCSTIARKLQTETSLQHPTAEGSRSTEAVHDRLKRLVFALHLLREEQKLDLLSFESSQPGSRSLGPVIAQLGYWLGWLQWSWSEGQFFHLESENMDRWAFDSCKFLPSLDSLAFLLQKFNGLISIVRIQFGLYNALTCLLTDLPICDKPSQPCEPPSITKWMGQIFQDGHSSGFPRLDFLLTGIDSDNDANLASWSKYVLSKFTPRTQALRHFFETNSEAWKRFSGPVERLHASGITPHVLETLPESCASLFRVYIQRWQACPPTTWHKSLLRLVSRQDLNSLLDDTLDVQDTQPLSHPTAPHERKHIRMICYQDNKVSASHHAGSRESERLVHSIFRQDRRWQEAQKLVNPLKPAVAEIHPRTGDSESRFLEAQKHLASLVYQRTMSLPSGQGILNLASGRSLVTEKLNISTFHATCNMQPSGNSVSVDRSNYTEEKVGWAFFHAGVNTGLRIPRHAVGINNSWIVLNKPSELGNRHAGLLLALGLNNHLHDMAKYLFFKYFSPKHIMTSVGLTLGICASKLGELDSEITRILSLSITRLLPPGSAELNISPLTQTAAVIGIGLLYHNSQHRRMSELVLSELEYADVEEHMSGHDSLKDEAYRLATGFALGLINLGRGHDLRILHDMRVVERLSLLATGPRDIKVVHILDQSTAGAVLAIALIFMKTRNAALATKIDVPKTTRQFDYIRPDILLLRTIAKWLIMWDDIEPSLGWVDHHCPKDRPIIGQPASSNYFERILSSSPFATSNIPFYNIVAGLCWSIALKYAGTDSKDALTVLHYYSLQVLKVLRGNPGTSFEVHLTRDMLLRFQHLLGLSMAIVCAGTGNLDVLRFLRSMHADVHKSFGFHQANHIAIGVLFMGHGRYSLCRSNLAVASMLIAFYPVFPKDVLDNRAHLQALRHFWVLAAEPRCLIPRDFETHQPIITPIKIILRDANDSQGVVTKEAPCLLPEVDTVAQVHIEYPEYWSVILDFANNPAHLAAFRKHQTVFLRRKPLLMQHGSLLGATLSTLDRRRSRHKIDPFEAMFDMSFFKDLGVDGAVVSEVLPVGRTNEDVARRGMSSEIGIPVQTLVDGRSTALDDFLALREDALAGNRDQVVGLRALLEDAFRRSRMRGEGVDEQGADMAEWLRYEWIGILQSLLLNREMKAMKDLRAQGKDINDLVKKRYSEGVGKRRAVTAAEDVMVID